MIVNNEGRSLLLPAQMSNAKTMNELNIQHLCKEFDLNSKQQKSRRTDSKVLKAVDDVSFSPRPGEIYGLLGPNGAGKTTTLRMIATILTPTSGSISFNGKDIYQNVNDYRRKIGFLTSELKLDAFFTPDYTFQYMSRLYGVDEETITKRKALLFGKMGIEEFKDVKIKNLSTGMKQKVSLAISLANDPDVIIFDEPTNGLDIIAAKAVEDYLLDLKSEGKIIIISTHIFSLVEKLADRVGILIDGHMQLEGSLKEITKETSLENVFFGLYDRVKGGRVE